MSDIKVKLLEIVQKIIKEDDICSLDVIPTDNDLKKLPKKQIGDILSKQYLSGSDMQMLLCIFKKLTISCIKQINNICDDNLFLKDSSELGKEGKTNKVLLSKILDGNVNVILKTVKRSDKNGLEYSFDDLKKKYFILLKEYELGIRGLNNLRQYTPCFMYTFGCFICDIPSKKTGPTAHKIKQNQGVPYLILEKIEGPTFGSFTHMPEFSFDIFVSIISQLLIALELAQREYQFCHFDLHLQNILIRRKIGAKYTVNIDEKSYMFTSDYIPVMIDYDLSLIKFSDTEKLSAKVGYEYIGISDYFISGRDTLQLLTRILANIIHLGTLYNSKKDAKKIKDIKSCLYDILELAFPNTVYNIINDADIKIITNEHYQRFFDDNKNLGPLLITPLEVFKIFYYQVLPKYQSSSKVISVMNRSVFKSASVKTIFEPYYNMALSNKLDIADNLKFKLLQCADGLNSYILSIYVSYIIEEIKMPRVKDLILFLTTSTTPEQIQIEYDRLTMYKKYLSFDIQTSTKLTLPIILEKFYMYAKKIMIADYNNNKHRRTLAYRMFYGKYHKFFTSYIQTYYENLTTYVTYYYIISEIYDKIDNNLIRDWCHDFQNSKEFSYFPDFILIYYKIRHVFEYIKEHI
jgi:hypothetical protein